MKRIGINVNRTKDMNGNILNIIKDIIFRNVDNAQIVILDTVDISKELLNSIDIIISLGGDGTILNTCRLVDGCSTPIFGVNIGNLGFLTSCDLNDFENELLNVLQGDYSVESRMLLQLNINDGEIYKYKALNDIVICKGTLSRIIEFNIHIDDALFTSFKADGIIVSTPTGSTAYSLSSGGPIVCPSLDVISITPICPHLLGMRTLVIDKKSIVKISYTSNSENVFITVDGQCSQEMDEKSYVKIFSAKETCNLITTDNYSFFSVLRHKIINNK